MHIAWATVIVPQRHGFPKLLATIPLRYKKCLKQEYRQEFLKWTFLLAKLEEEPKHFNLMCAVTLLIKLSTVVVSVATITQFCICGVLDTNVC